VGLNSKSDMILFKTVSTFFELLDQVSIMVDSSKLTEK